MATIKLYLDQHFIDDLSLIESKLSNIAMIEIVDLLKKGEFSIKDIDKILSRHSIKSIILLKNEALNLLLDYIEIVLDKDSLDPNKYYNIAILKRVFKIKEGDFFNLKFDLVENILNREFEKLYNDNVIDSKEEIFKVDLQSIFDLSYDQFAKYREIHVFQALNRGANPNSLDIANLPKLDY